MFVETNNHNNIVTSFEVKGLPLKSSLFNKYNRGYLLTATFIYLVTLTHTHTHTFSQKHKPNH